MAGFDISTLKDPFRFREAESHGFELVEQLGWESSRRGVVYPTRRRGPVLNVEIVLRN